MNVISKDNTIFLFFGHIVKIIVHPECVNEVAEAADVVASTEGIIRTIDVIFDGIFILLVLIVTP